MPRTLGANLYKTLCRFIKNQRAALEYECSWPACNNRGGRGMRGVVASVDVASSLTEKIRAQDQVPEVHLDWEDFLQRPEVRDQNICKLLRPLFDTEASNDDTFIWANLQFHHPALSMALKFNPNAPNLDMAFAAIRQASSYQFLLDDMQEMLHLDNADIFGVTPKRRSKEVLFAVSDILTHRFFGPCVVVGWDKTCQADESWIRNNKIHQILEHGTEQPFYNVLLEADDIPRYCSQENLELSRMFTAQTTKKLRLHPHAAFYFKGPAANLARNSYNDSPNYVVPFTPSEALAHVYPEDLDHTQGERDFRRYSNDSHKSILASREVLFRDE